MMEPRRIGEFFIVHPFGKIAFFKSLNEQRILWNWTTKRFTETLQAVSEHYIFGERKNRLQ